MTTPMHRFPLLQKKSLHIAVPLLDVAAWSKAVAADPHVPRNAAQLRRLWDELMQHRREERRKPVERLEAPVARGHIVRRHEECSEAAFARLELALASPFLGERDLLAMEALMDADLPQLGEMLESEHFILRWTSSSTHAADNLTDPRIVQETADYLEAAWRRYAQDFGRAPYLAPGRTKIEVTFWDIGTPIGATTPNGPISLNASRWQIEPGVRKPTSAHELFHRMQFAFGYRTVWTPVQPFKWFSEGMASWAEVYMWQRVSGAYKINDLFAMPDLNLLEASYKALPFWLFFDTRQRDTPGDLPVLDYLTSYEASGNDKAVLAGIVASEWPADDPLGNIDNFFALFARERRTGLWRRTQSGADPFPTILGPDDAMLAPALAVTSVPLGAGDTYVVSEIVAGLGSDYYAFSFAPDSDGLTLTLSLVLEAATEFSCFLVWEMAGAMQSSDFVVLNSLSHSIQRVIDLSSSDGLVLAICGRSLGGRYDVTAQIATPPILPARANA